jgi:hypothetical protein
MRVAILLPHFPHELKTALQVAAPQHEAAIPHIWWQRQYRGGRVCVGRAHTVPTLGTASSGIDSNAPMVAIDFGGVCGQDGGAHGCGDDVSCSSCLGICRCYLRE